VLLEQFLKDSNLADAVKRIEDNRFRYTYVLGSIDFISLRDASPSRFFEMHTDTWCENRTEFFIALIGENVFHLCDSKTKPDSRRPIENASIDSFTYGDNSPKAQRYMDLFKKENIDTGQCLKEMRDLLKTRTRKTVDKDLLENLKVRRNRIIQLLSERNDKKELAQKIMDRCLFIRFLEDRAGRDNLKDTLSNSHKIEDLIQLFDFYNDSLNGDIFEKGDIPKDIDVRIMRELDYVFGKVYTHPQNHQTTLIPYNFKKIPIILISNIYETFLAEKRRKSEGIVFTPENVVDYTLSKMLEENRVTALLENEHLGALDPACGSGVFLVKFFERLMRIKQAQSQTKLTLEEKAWIVQNNIYGIDKNNDALRIAALSLYLKIIEDETPKDINEKLFSNSKEHFMFPGLKKNGNLVCGDSLFDDIFKDKQFDFILGNPPWGYDFSEKDKRRIKTRWPSVSKYQSSQCFLLSLQKWTKKETICGMVVNLSNFINSESRRFRNRFTSANSLRVFVSLSRIKDVTFGPQSEPACIIIFDRMPNDEVEFIIPDLTPFSNLTKIINDDNKSRLSTEKLKKEDNLWHIYSLGYDAYVDLIAFIDSSTRNLNHFKQRFEEGLHQYSNRSGLTQKQFNAKYRSSTRVGPTHWPIIDSLSNVQPYFGKEKDAYLQYGPHLDRPRDLDLFKGDKLIITRSWPIKAFLDHNIRLYDTRFWIFKLRSDYPKEYLVLFEAILNSKLARFYLGVKHRQRREGNYPKVNLKHLRSFPIPNLEDKTEIVKAIVDKVGVIDSNLFDFKGLHDEIDRLVCSLYDLDYYAMQQVNHYEKIEDRPEGIVSGDEISEYCKEFSETFHPFLKDDLCINAAFYVSDFFGTMVEFTISKTKCQIVLSDEKLKPFIRIIEQNQVRTYDRTRIFKEEKNTFYDAERLYIYKSNRPKDWTRFMAIKDANEEIGLFLQKV
jgi:type I restriction-modification system DNA methylase subunit